MYRRAFSPTSVDRQDTKEVEIVEVVKTESAVDY